MQQKPKFAWGGAGTVCTKVPRDKTTIAFKVLVTLIILTDAISLLYYHYDWR
jgi:hypothetical protein